GQARSVRGDMSRGLVELPFRVQPGLSALQRTRVEAAALRANDRYVIDFLEEHGLCPYARTGRERGLTARHVVIAELASIDRVVQVFEAAAASELQVVQVIFALAEVAPQEFARFVSELTEALNLRQPLPVFASAALHPELAYRTDSATGLISLFRCAPDPTLQWVRLESLYNFYRGRKGGTSFVDLGSVRDLFGEPQKRDLYQEIAHNNQQSAER